MPDDDLQQAAVVLPQPTARTRLRLMASQELDSLDPIFANLLYSWSVQRLLNRTLVAFAPEPDNYGVVPDLALEPGSSRDGATVWSYRLRGGVRFATGEPVDAEAVARGIRRYLRHGSGVDGDVLGQLLTGPPGSASGPDARESIRIRADNVIEFHLNRPCPEFDHVVARPMCAPYGLVVGSDTCGPYRVAPDSTSRWVHLERNPFWERSTDPVRAARVDSVVIDIGATPQEICRAVMSGRADLALDTNVQGEALGVCLSDPELSGRLELVDTDITRYVSIQTAIPPFDNVHARRAVLHAVDPEKLLGARGPQGISGRVAHRILPRSMSVREWDLPPAHDLAAARRELQAAGLGDGFRTRLLCVDAGKGRAVAEELVRQLSTVGIAADLVPVDQGRLYRDLLGRPDVVRREELGLAVCAWAPDFPTPSGFYQSILCGEQITPAGNKNYAELRDGEIDRLLGRIAAVGDPSDRDDLCEAVERRVREAAVLVPFAHDQSLWLRGRRVVDAFVLRPLGLHDLANVGVGQAGEED